MIQESEYLDELSENLANGDEVKAKLVVAHLDGQSPELQSRILRKLENFEGDIAVPVLGEMLDIPIGSLSISRAQIAEAVSQRVMSTPRSVTRLSEDAQIQVAAMLGELGDARALKPLRVLILQYSDSANLRFTVYESLGRLPMSAGAYMLAAGLEDKDAAVRVAAARAIDKNLSDTLRQGVLNMLGNPDPAPAATVSAIAQAGALNTIAALLDDDRFARLFGEYLELQPDPEFLRRVEPLLEKNQRHSLVSLVRSYLGSLTETQGPVIYAVDDSNTVLRMYRAALNRVTSVMKTFDNPFEAIEWVEKEPPDLLFTDLNMPGIDGIELASTLRSNAAVPYFPIVMVTTESEGESLERAFNSGVDHSIHKPFQAVDLIEAINDLSDFDL